MPRREKCWRESGGCRVHILNHLISLLTRIYRGQRFDKLTTNEGTEPTSDRGIRPDASVRPEPVEGCATQRYGVFTFLNLRGVTFPVLWDCRQETA